MARTARQKRKHQESLKWLRKSHAPAPQLPPASLPTTTEEKEPPQVKMRWGLQKAISELECEDRRLTELLSGNLSPDARASFAQERRTVRAKIHELRRRLKNLR